MNKQQKENAVAIKTAIDNINTAKSRFAPIGKSGGGVAQTMTLSLTDDAFDNRAVSPRQVQLVLGLLDALGGTATVKQIDDLAVISEGDLAWVNASGVAYEQTPSKILRTYISKMKGDDAWSKRHGEVALVS
jgi:hypothetical protein|tara:strand:+ start:402 stop:797 length:396 start_codon:yes stop_codon:yes gene_type:complete